MLEKDIEASRLEGEAVYDKIYKNEDITDIDMSGIEFNRVKFHNCRIIGCNYEKASFYNVEFKDCNVSNCIFSSSYFKDSKMINCKGNGVNFNYSTLKSFSIEGGIYSYGNFSNTLWENSAISDSDFSESFFSETKFKKIKFSKVNLSKADFFKTPLKGIDLSDCSIEGIVVSDSYYELKGLKVSVMQTVDIAVLMGIKIV